MRTWEEAQAASKTVIVVQVPGPASGSYYGQILLLFSCFDIREGAKRSPERRFSTGGLRAKIVVGRRQWCLIGLRPRGQFSFFLFFFKQFFMLKGILICEKCIEKMFFFLRDAVQLNNFNNWL